MFWLQSLLIVAPGERPMEVLVLMDYVPRYMLIYRFG